MITKENIQTINPCILIIFGSTGDLAKRKLFPALYHLFTTAALPSRFAVVAVGRKAKTTEEFRNYILEALTRHSQNKIKPQSWADFAALVYYHRMDLKDPGGYQSLKEVLDQLDQKLLARGNRVYYLAVAPDFFVPIVKELAKEGLAINRKNSWRRLVIEKPFGWDLESARKLNVQITEVFEEKEIFRIDHYLGKEMIQNIMAIRFANTLFEPLWNNKYIDHVQISSCETVGIGERGSYYEKSGALRDMIQNHMLQLLTLIAMEPPASLDTEAIRNEKVKLLSSLVLPEEEELPTSAVRGQYSSGIAGKKEVAGYREEPEVSPVSNTETFAALQANIENFRWAGVPFYLRTGKRLPRKSTVIVIQFNSLPGVLYFKENRQLEPNLLVIRIQPLEGVFLQINTKKPGNKNLIIPAQLDFCQNCEFETNSPEAYERLLYDIIRGETTLFTRWDEVEYAWRYVDVIGNFWNEIEPRFPNYPAGSWGPEAATILIERNNRQWWNP